MDKYIGFYIDKPIGNNIFSYEDRENKKIYVPKLIEGTLDDVSVGEEIVLVVVAAVADEVCLPTPDVTLDLIL